MAPIRLAILEADTPQPKAKAKYGGYGGVFSALLDAACMSLDPPQSLASQLSLTVHDVVNDLGSYPALDAVDAVLITGSKHSAYEDDAWIVKLVEYTRQCIEGGVRVIGVCFGHQIVGRAMGAPVGRSRGGWEVAVIDVDLTEDGKRIFGMDKMRIHQMHRDEVAEFPAGSVPLARTDLCPVQGMYVPKKYITVQGHPEFTADIVAEILNVRHEAGIFTGEAFEEAMSRVGLTQDGIEVAKAFLKFLRE